MTTMEQLHACVAETIELLKRVRVSAFEGKEAKEIVVQLGFHTFTFAGVLTLHKLALPTFFPIWIRHMGFFGLRVCRLERRIM